VRTAELAIDELLSGVKSQGNIREPVQNSHFPLLPPNQPANAFLGYVKNR